MGNFYIMVNIGKITFVLVVGCGGEGRDEGAMGKKGGLKGQFDEISTHQFLITELTLLRKNL